MNEAEKLERQEREREAMRQAIAAYTGPITKCPAYRSTNAWLSKKKRPPRPFRRIHPSSPDRSE
jgi:hypothetical protein